MADDPKKREPAQNRWQNKRVGKFRLLSLLGRGAMGKVFLAEDTTLRRQVALKIVSVRKGDRRAEAKAQQFIREARAAAKLNHPNIVNVLEIDQQNELLYIAMDLVQGGDVKQLIQNSGKLTPARACDLAADAGDALAFGHRLGVLHRDVKPGNLMLTREGRAKLADFGLADLGDPNDDFRLPNGIIGTPSTMAPEVARGEPAVAASDQYSLGCTAWHMLTGEPPFVGKNYREVLEQQVSAPLPPLAERCTDLPASLVAAIEKSLAKDPAERHADCETFARLLRGHSIALGPADSSGSMSSPNLVLVRPPIQDRKNYSWLIAGASIAALVIGIGGTVWVLGSSGSADPPTTTQDNEPAASVPSEPEPTPARPVTPPVPVATEPPPSFTADQTDEIKPLVPADTVVTVTGVVATAQLSASGKTFLVKFEGNHTGDFQVIWKPRLYAKMAEAFGGENGEGLVGKPIRVTGELSSMFGTPQINVTRPEQLRIVE
ncbi:MAG: serine/threonine-protein kinase [Planctomycetota bacterium]